MNKYTETKKKIYTTTNYEIFKYLEGNRDIKNGRVVKTVESIENHGWLTQPILVNEKMEVIDGQGRLEALKRLNMPVEFVIDYGIGLDECRTLNVYQKNWSIHDYIDSYVCEENDNYIWLKTQVERYKELTDTVVIAICSVNVGCVNLGGQMNYKIKDGTFEVNSAERMETESLLFFLSRFVDIAHLVGGRKDRLYGALSFLYSIESVDNERLFKAISNGRYELVSGGTVESYITQFDRLYNKGLAKKNRVDIEHEYKIA